MLQRLPAITVRLTNLFTLNIFTFPERRRRGSKAAEPGGAACLISEITLCLGSDSALEAAIGRHFKSPPARVSEINPRSKVSHLPPRRRGRVLFMPRTGAP
ncbi:hypothetical protein EVAR_76005_1 [Eumeta japonica]|uniref:Uncharacterized protein n=1 Tax=Eumeta variegata TaxID=151549 RepID=A0A4C1UA88_EUMVA|nr:hypothetical protein EVAR_76005_1 [Eumeta japonica]